MQTELLTAAPELPGYPCAFSEDRRYRYVLWRCWVAVERPRYLMVIGLNPSTADETQDDPTIRRCVGFAKDWGFDALCMTNLFAFRATDPAVMKATDDPEGPDNGEWLKRLAAGAGLILAAWGVHGVYMGQAGWTTGTIRDDLSLELHALGTTKDGHPRHPLYMPKAAQPTPYP
jgi:hypothetical protein